VVSLQLVIVSDSYSQDSPIVLEEISSTDRYRLFDADGRPFPLPSLFRLPEGTQIDVTGFPDGQFPGGDGTGIEVISVEVSAIGVGGGADTDGDLLGDQFKYEYFGTEVIDAFQDPDGDGYSTLQEALEGTDPLDSGDFPAVPAEDLRPPEIDLTIEQSRTLVTFEFPLGYDHRIGFALESSTSMNAFDSDGHTAERTGTGTGLEIVMPHPPALPRRNFHRIRMVLR
jgi:hypothetical protein